jgi:hypothetical protein
MTRGLDLAALARHVKERRESLRWSQAEISAHGGPGEATVRRIERQEVTDIQPKTRERLELALGWPDGLVDKILAGEVTDDEVAKFTARADRVFPARGPEWQAARAIPADPRSAFGMVADLVAYLSDRLPRDEVEDRALDALRALLLKWVEQGQHRAQADDQE